ncbi:uncharacterized protein LACBIDRAFT_299427 [Laccaria bicolor S238N-H82]|uniref:Predicted protein n=1 Tax=Laccaria bicolor (strain S238N-H82 / ATCC MYA-4686) TaxID=486041 RepID=B0DEN8_LACBS|nr:uncharacterized protein LACBIDRAFT_299427 [Laccaria bicolor S238N-H82]EDR07061.1 predicted protein [Laccaria bicolor S238N-H82]|eukprot:XP_001882434.1 predicted protein [Laccaria bicolor S238N-H82]
MGSDFCSVPATSVDAEWAFLLWLLSVTGSYVKLSSSINRLSTTVLVVETKWITTMFAWPLKRHGRF